MSQDKLVLAIETSLKKGSLSLLRNGTEVGNWSGDEVLSRSEDLVLGIKQLLDDISVEPKDIDLIAISTGPGSFTGLRVGIAVGKGLALATGCRLVGVSIFESIVYAAHLKNGLTEKNIICIVGAGFGNLNSQSFSIENGFILPSSEINLISNEEFFREIGVLTEASMLIYERNLEGLVSSFELLNENLKQYCVTEDIGQYTGLVAISNFRCFGNYHPDSQHDVNPIYVRNL